MPGATHAPHHPTPEWIKKISDMHLFDEGWNKLRETIFANQKRLGIMPENAKLTPWPKELPQWDSLSLEEKKLFIRQVDVYGAYLAYTDHEIGRVIQAVEDLGELDNTLIIYIGGDNGASAEGMLNGTPNEFTTFNGVPGARQGSAALVPVLGIGTDVPALRRGLGVGDGYAVQVGEAGAVALRRHGAGRGRYHGRAISTTPVGIRRQFHHVIDIVPTILEATGIAQPDTINGIKQRPIDRRQHDLHVGQGQRRTRPPAPPTQYFEMLGNRAIYQDGWVAATTPATLAVGAEHRHAAGRDHRLQVGAL